MKRKSKGNQIGTQLSRSGKEIEEKNCIQKAIGNTMPYIPLTAKERNWLQRTNFICHAEQQRQPNSE